MTKRSRDYYRKVRKKAIRRKMKILFNKGIKNPKIIDRGHASELEFCNDFTKRNEICSEFPGTHLSYYGVSSVGKLAKGKIHCSCEMCRFDDVSMSDRRKADEMRDQLNEAFYDDDLHISAEVLNQTISKLAKDVDFVKGYHPKGLAGSSTHHRNKDVKKSDGYNEYLDLISDADDDVKHPNRSERRRLRRENDNYSECNPFVFRAFEIIV